MQKLHLRIQASSYSSSLGTIETLCGMNIPSKPTKLKSLKLENRNFTLRRKA
jgi:hypothetical protein